MNFEKILDYSGEKPRQFLVLVRHFFHRLFINDVVSFEEQMVQKIIGIIVILAIFSGHLANVLLFKYMLMPDEGTSWVEECYFIFFLLFIFYLFLWGWQNALLRCLYGLVVSTFLIEIAFIGYHKIPFECSYLPGKAKMYVFRKIEIIYEEEPEPVMVTLESFK